MLDFDFGNPEFCDRLIRAKRFFDDGVSHGEACAVFAIAADDFGTFIEMVSEARHFINHGMPKDRACNVVGLPPSVYEQAGKADRISYLPTPAEIDSLKREIRTSGERKKWSRRR